MQKWEYAIVPMFIDESSEVLRQSCDELGEQGWELISTIREPDTGEISDRRIATFIFKRPLEEG